MWQAIPGYVGFYEASADGRIRSVTRTIRQKNGKVRTFPGVELKLQTNSRNGYVYVGLNKEGAHRLHRVHRLILSTFVGPCPEGKEALHGPGGQQDNSLANLRWGTRTENMQDMSDAGNHREARKTHCRNGHPYNEKNTYLRPDKVGRGCRQCMLDRNRKARQVTKYRGLYKGKGESYVT